MRAVLGTSGMTRRLAPLADDAERAVPNCGEAAPEPEHSGPSMPTTAGAHVPSEQLIRSQTGAWQ